MIPHSVKPLLLFQMTRVFGSLFLMVMVEAKICLIHETVVQHRKNVQGAVHETNLTVVKVHNCPIYTRCCEAETTCCFDYSWFWSTLGVILVLLLLSGLTSACDWYKKKHHRTVATSNNDIALPSSVISHTAVGPEPVLTAESPRVPEPRISAPPPYPKPPMYTSVSPIATIPQPGASCPYDPSEEPPPPYSAAVAAAAASYEDFTRTQTTTV